MAQSSTSEARTDTARSSAATGSRTETAPPTTTTSRSAAAEPGRLDVVAAALKKSPLYVDDELSWMLDAEQTRKLRKDLRDARVPVLVAFLPSLTEDESGGDTERVLRTLQQRVGRDAVYVTVDDRGRFDLASVGIPLDLGISFSLLYPPRDERPYDEQEADPGPAGWTTVPGRLREVLRYVRDAEPGTPNGIIDTERIRPLRTLPGHHKPANSTQDIVGVGVFGLFLGLIGSGSLLAIRRATRKAASPPPSNRRHRRKGRRRG